MIRAAHGTRAPLESLPMVASSPYAADCTARPRPAICDAFIKVGGSILDDPAATAALVPILAALSKECRLVAMCGGGRVAKRIVTNQRCIGSDFFHSWRAGITSLDVHAGLLASYSPDFIVASSVFEIAERLAKGKMPVLAPAAKIVSDLVLVPDFEVTTDSMGLYFANLLGASRYVVVSDVDGIYPNSPGSGASLEPLARLTPEELEALPSSKLDRAFPAYFRLYPLPTAVVNGKHPDRVRDAVRGRCSAGTEIASVDPQRQPVLDALSTARP
jgi:aspartokinase-like uncharacterized kinase